MITYRKAKTSEISQIIDLLLDDELGKNRENTADLSTYLKAFEEISADKHQYLMLMLKDEQIMSTFHLTLIPSLSRNATKRGNIEAVRMAKNYRGMGYGQKMIEYAIELAKENGAKMIQLTSDKKRIAAKTFYEKLGFQATHEGMKMSI